jgi:signal transduction histidine kinase
MAHAVATEDLLPHMARIVAEGTGAARVEVWLQVGQDLVREATWPDDGADGSGERIPLGDKPLDDLRLPGLDSVIRVGHQGEPLGAIGVRWLSSGAVTPANERLLRDLASQAGLVLRNVRLVEELRTSRQRLVAAQDEERRRLERELHDGAQQRITAIGVTLRLAGGMVRPEADPRLGTRLDQASEQITLALSELREFARGIHPAILTERGLGPALESLAERSTVPATVHAELDGRLPAPVEAAAYFVVSEALANVGKYSMASAVTISVERTEDRLVVTVQDDGVGGADPSRGSGLRGLSDRVATVEGTLSVVSPPGEGTTLICRIPLEATVVAEPAPTLGQPVAVVGTR